MRYTTNNQSMEDSTISNEINKEQLFDIVHDLKSPFTALLGISEILISDWDELSDEEKLELIKGLRTTSENTLQLLEKLQP